MESVSASSSYFLSVVLKTLWNSSVNDEPYVHLINTHAKGDCCYNDIDLVSHPSVLYVFSSCITHATVVEVTLNFILRKLTA